MTIDAGQFIFVSTGAVLAGAALNIYGAWVNARIARRNLAEIERLRQFGLAADPYCDAAFEPRQCDHCHRVYRGPAVYCSLTCAVADA